MKKITIVLILLSLVSAFLVGCIQWETPEKYTLIHDSSGINSIRIYQDNYEAFYQANGKIYNYSDPNEPCGALLGEIPAEQYATFAKELTGLSFTKHHIIFLFPVSYDPNFYYGNYIVKIEYHDGSCELISDVIQRQFRVNEKYPDTLQYSADDEAWLAFLQNWVELPD